MTAKTVTSAKRNNLSALLAPLLLSLLWGLGACANGVDPDAVASDAAKVSEAAPAETGVSVMAVHSELGWTTLDDFDGIESAHPYANYTDESWRIVAPAGAHAIRLHFADVDLERGYDYLEVLDGDDTRVQVISGSYGTFTTDAIAGEVATLRFRSDFSITGEGFRLVAVEIQSGAVDCPAREVCGPESLDISRHDVVAPGVCPPAAECIDISSFSAKLTVGGGFAGTHTGTMVQGDGVVSTTFSGRGSDDITEVGTSPAPWPREVLKTLYRDGYFEQTGTSGQAGNWTHAFTARFNGAERTMLWADGTAAPDQLEVPLALFAKATTCGDSTETVMACFDGLQCVEGICDDGPDEPSCICTEQYQPVCGVDGRTFSNACFAGCHNIAVDYEGECEEPPNTACRCAWTDEPLCGTDGRDYANPCLASCNGASIKHYGACGIEGDICGTSRSLSAYCQEGLRCRYGESRFEPWQSEQLGQCVAENYCDAPSDCDALPHIMCVGAWTCADNTCGYACSPGPILGTWESETTNFGTDNPYGDNQTLGWRATGPSDATAVRVTFSRFDLEDGYDFVTLYDEGWNLIATYTGDLGAFVSAEVPGNVARIVFRSDYSITGPGFRGAEVEYYVPAP